MFGSKQRHRELVTLLVNHSKRLEEFSKEVAEVKEYLSELEISEVIKTMEEFIASSQYIKTLIESAEVEVLDNDNQVSCCNPFGE